jgi:hypothetical protein
MMTLNVILDLDTEADAVASSKKGSSWIAIIGNYNLCIYVDTEADAVASSKKGSSWIAIIGNYNLCIYVLSYLGAHFGVDATQQHLESIL